MRWMRSFVLVVAVVLLLGGIFLAGYLLGAYQDRSAAADGIDLSLLRQVQSILDRSFMGEIPAETAQVYGAIHGMVSAYQDRYTIFVEPAPREYERDELAGHFGGIGAYVGRNDAGEVVLTVIRDRPAERAGIMDGDVLLAVDAQPVTPELTVQDIVVMIRGDVGEPVVLTLRRSDRPDSFTVSVIRERIETPSVEWRVLDDAAGIGYVRISIFGERTGDELVAGLSELADSGVTRLVLDLRGNGGGLVDAAIEITSQFLNDGIVFREMKRGDQERFYPVKSVHSPAQSWELVLLVDAGTASASEIVAGALRDQGHAVLIGEKTYGKGSVQEVHELPDGSSLHITVARWLTPNRHQIDDLGLEPDVTVNISAEDRDAGRDPQLARAVAWLRGQH